MEVLDSSSLDCCTLLEDDAQGNSGNQGDTFTLYLSLYSAVVTSLLGIGAFYFARREYRRSGPVVTAKLVRGHFLTMAPFVALSFADKVATSFVVPLLPGARIRPPARQFPIIGVYAQNVGRSPVTVREISVKMELELSEEYITEIRSCNPNSNFSTCQLMILGTYLTAKAPPRRLEPHEGEFWCVSMMDFSGYEASGDLVGSFVVTLDEGRTCESESFRVFSKEGRRMTDTYSALVTSGEPEPETIEENGRFGRIVSIDLPPTAPSPYLEYQVMRAPKRFFSSSTFDLF